VVLRRRDRVVSGESQVTTTFRNIKFESEAKAILGSLGLRGPGVMQAFIVEGGLQIIECNPRFGGASTASIAVGLDSLYWSLLETTGHSEIQTFNRAPIEVQQIRTSNDRIIYGSYI
jgi:carbamoyl-phosphate synthase large subunit